MKVKVIVAVLLGCGLAGTAAGQVITFEKRDATVWSQDQVVRGTSDVSQGILRVGDARFPFEAPGGTFSVPVWIREGTTSIIACTIDEETCPDTLNLTLGYPLRPEVELVASVSGRAVTLTGRVLANPDSADLSFEWKEDLSNPAPVALSETSDSTAAFVLPDGVPKGEYYFDWLVFSDDTVRARTFVSLDSTGVVPFDIRDDHAAWVDSAVIYEVTPYIFEEFGKLHNVTARIPELADFGVNTIWLQPVFGTGFGGQGYDITDYFSVRRDYGTEKDLHDLIATARQYGMRVMLDFVPNHTSIQHPYAQDAITHGEASHYVDFYQRVRDSVPYSQHYNTRNEGNMTFTYYFWEDLPNLNYDNPEVRRMMIEAGKYWIEEFDVDGYRIDAVWGVNARAPEFMKEWRLALKRIKPEVLLLGEDKATQSSIFDERFDVAYDWYPEESWVSHWTWQTDFNPNANPTIFNTANENNRTNLLRNALTNRGNGWHPDAKVLRFMENNDAQRFIVHHGVERTKMAATLLFSLPGVPLIYNGQEIGVRTFPYDAFMIFRPGATIESQDRNGLYPYYQHLIELRNAFPALHSDQFAEVPTGPDGVEGHVYAYRRWEGEQHILGVINMADNAASVTLQIPVDDLELDDATTYYLNDLITGEPITATRAELAEIPITVPAYTTRLFALSDSVMHIGLPTPVEEPDALPVQVALEQNYPNPFGASTTIPFVLPNPGAVRLAVFDVLGREVVRLVDGTLTGGRHSVAFDGNGLASGLYLYRIDFEGKQQVGRMTLVK